VKPIRNQPIPHNLRAQVLQRIATMPESDVAQVHELLLLAEKLRLRAEISKQAEAENERATWLDLPELIAAYRAQKKPA
jgi:predicted transcriptional regulator